MAVMIQNEFTYLSGFTPVLANNIERLSKSPNVDLGGLGSLGTFTARAHERGLEQVAMEINAVRSGLREVEGIVDPLSQPALIRSYQRVRHSLDQVSFVLDPELTLLHAPAVGESTARNKHAGLIGAGL